MGCNPLFITSLNSGSNGNCYYVGNAKEAVLIDAGISCRETEKRMLRLGLSMGKIKAIFISHEHGDHIRGLTVMAKKYRIPVYITPGTIGNSKLKLPEDLVNSFTSHQVVEIGSLQITCFPKIHDAAEPHSFMVSCEDIKVGVFTDLGIVCEQLTHHFKQCDAAFLETNYDEELLQQGNYPYYLKKRISDGFGHLSNKQALELFINSRPARLTHLLLAHLSKDNNNPVLVENLFKEHAQDTMIIVASRDMETPLFTIGGASNSSAEISPLADSALRAQYS
ncbi:phosphoribosyl 1,2-cyclic phosphodiesterase [Pedobacter cryoconitis]|uniref:MBL fold metallo-hydrolase n=1 Tax=Pedobacter cryoconitis TaxID=188932 RepID=UPI00161563B3|nr:MBL fold metallo-hydrolase [Pedobacter cryoconitis]MBB6272957.1 phosphoribosyl 1,2-cyclic phosphodiesterase [Pedobacter cryoconitis]